MVFFNRPTVLAKAVPKGGKDRFLIADESADCQTISASRGAVTSKKSNIKVQLVFDNG
jgi:hypothetical protein